LTEGERISRKALEYPTKPIIFNAQEAINSGAIQQKGNSIILRFNSADAERIHRDKFQVGPSEIYDLTDITVFGLDEATAKAGKGSILRDKYMDDFGRVKSQIETTGRDPIDFGTWVFYPRDKKLIHYVSEEWHRLAICLSNSMLLLDPEMKNGFFEMREKLESAVVADIGLSVGNDAKEAVVRNLRPENYILSDPADYKMTNTGRVLGLRAEDIVLSNAEKEYCRTHNIPNLYGGRPKWQVAAEQIHAIDPFINVFCYKKADETNLPQFLEGNRVQPRANILIEICDTLSVKVEAAKFARDLGIMFFRGTDAGSTARLDVYRYDRDKTLPLAHGVDDAKLRLLASLSGKSFENFMKFANALIGRHLNGRAEFPWLMRNFLPPVSTSIPQLPSTAMVLGGLIGEYAGRGIMGHDLPDRTVVKIFQRKVKTYKR
jgi:hypothetical protein